VKPVQFITWFIGPASLLNYSSHFQKLDAAMLLICQPVSELEIS